MTYIAVHCPEKCRQCAACSEIVVCPGAEEFICIGCRTCVLVCPHQALKLVATPRERRVNFEINGESATVPEQIGVKDALIEAWRPPALSYRDKGLFAPCDVGGCGSCAVEIDGAVKLACRTIVREGMMVRTNVGLGQTVLYALWEKGMISFLGFIRLMRTFKLKSY